MTTPTCAVVICTHSDHRLHDVLAAVNSVTAQQPSTDEVIGLLAGVLRRLCRFGATGARGAYGAMAA